jgi:hypothetical protein
MIIFNKTIKNNKKIIIQYDITRVYNNILINW